MSNAVKYKLLGERGLTKAICLCWFYTSIPCSLSDCGITPPTILYSSWAAAFWGASKGGSRRISHACDPCGIQWWKGRWSRCDL